MKRRPYSYMGPLAFIVGMLLLYRFAILPGRSPVSSLAETVVQTDGDDFSCTFDGISHDVILDLPEEPAGAALILMLHGYGNSAESFRADTGFEKDAIGRGYAVAYVTGAPDPNDATSAAGWNSGVGDSPNRDVDFLDTLAQYLQAAYKLDKKRTFVVGFSNGAFMAHRLAVEDPDTFAAVVSVAGMMPESIWESCGGAEYAPAGLFQITGEKDDVVPKHSDGSAKYAKAPAIEDVVDYYVSTNGLILLDTVDVGKKAVLSKFGVSGDAPAGTSKGGSRQVWNLFIGDGRHSWPDESTTGIDINTLILDYLDTESAK
ncbi:MAG: prolyl oligopeptidase family serine peptidase [Lachnospiraceae bacterium]|nr:prolyl oligopeptidase family serine peptidase [Lachnospiraceae bacterium]